MRSVLVLLCVGCAAAAHPAPRAILVIHADVPDAALWVDEQLVADVGTLASGVSLPAGEHRVELRHDRYHTRYLDVTLVAGEHRTVDVKLAEALP